MKDMRDTLEPTVDDLFEALEPLRAEPESFAAGVATRIDGQEIERDETVARSTREWPAWMRRAASIAPPGAMGALGVAKASTAKIGTAAAGVGWATPLAALFVGGLGIFAATFRLRGDRGDEGLDVLKRRSAFVLPWLFLAAMFVPAWMIFTVGPKAVGIAAVLLQVVATIVIVRVMSAVGRANRAVLGGVLAAFFIEISIFHLYFLPHASGPSLLTRLASPFVLVATACVLQVVARRSGWTGNALKAFWQRLGALGTVAVAVVVVAMLFVAVNRRVLFGSSSESIVRWANTVAAPADDLGTWTGLGRVALALEPDALERVDCDRLRASIAAAEKRLHPMVALGALRLGVLEESEYERSLGDYWLKSPKFVGKRMGYPGDTWLKIEYLEAKGLFVGELRDAARQLLEKSWPEVVSFMSIERAAAVLEVAEAAGFHDLVAEKLPEIPAFLEAAWVGRRLPAWEDCGFEALHVQDDGQLSKAEHSSNSGTSFAATVLMARLVENSPDARDSTDALGGLDIELTSFLRYLDSQRGYFTRLGAHNVPVDTGLARHLLLRTAPLPRPSAPTWLLAHAVLVSTLASCVIALAAIARAPSGATVWDGP